MCRDSGMVNDETFDRCSEILNHGSMIKLMASLFFVLRRARGFHVSRA